MIENRSLFNITARGYDFLTRQELWRDQIRKTLNFVDEPKTIRHVIDLGCGPGISTFVLAELLPHARVTGVDLSEKMIGRARTHRRKNYAHLPNLRFRRADIYELPFDDETFDLAVGHSFLYLLPDRLGALAAIRQVLVPGGRVVLLEPNAEGSLLDAARQAPGRRLIETPLATSRFAMSMLLWRVVSGSRGQFALHELKDLFNSAGLQHVDVQPTLAGLGAHATGRR